MKISMIYLVRSPLKCIPTPEVPSLQIFGQTTLRNNQWQAIMKYFPCSYWFTQKNPVVFTPQIRRSPA
jgi:hypothetical protein